MTGITIPKEIYERQLSLLKQEYVELFGRDALSNEVKQFTRQQTIQRYARSIIFWQERIPEIYVGITTEDIARHAICTNSLRNTQDKVKEYDIEKAVSEAIVAIKSSK